MTNYNYSISARRALFRNYLIEASQNLEQTLHAELEQIIIDDDHNACIVLTGLSENVTYRSYQTVQSYSEWGFINHVTTSLTKSEGGFLQ